MYKNLHYKIILIFVIFTITLMTAIGAIMISSASTFYNNDFLDQMQQMKNMGSMEQILSMMPGMNSKALKGLKIDERQMARTEAIIKSMTMRERERPDIINFSRRKGE